MICKHGKAADKGIIQVIQEKPFVYSIAAAIMNLIRVISKVVRRVCGVSMRIRF